MNRDPIAPPPAPSEEAAARALTATFQQLNEEGQHKILTYAVDLTAAGVYAKNVVRFSWLKAKRK